MLNSLYNIREISSQLDEYKLEVYDNNIVSKTDVNGVITYVNDNFCTMSGYEKEELLGKTHKLIRHEDIEVSIHKEMWETIQSKRPWHGIIRNTKKDGTIYYVQSTINPILDCNGNIVEYISLRTDITEIKLTKVELVANLHISNQQLNQVNKISQEYQKAIEESNILLRVNTYGYITYVNDKFCEISGYSHNELIGKSHKSLRYSTNLKKQYKEIYSSITKGKTWHGQLQNINKNAEAYYLDTTIVPIFDNNNILIEYLAICHDITDMIKIHQELEVTQREIIFTMGAVGESRCEETGNHVKRVAEYSQLLALLAGLGKEQANLLQIASPMHDIGKVGIPDHILKKRGKLTPKEWAVMKTHSKIGYNILKNSQRPLLQAAATVSLTHHEKWDGSGYPNKVKGENIHIFGRITAISDVFDALGSDRVYKKAWTLEKILILFEEEKAKHFDPYLVELFLNNLDKFLYIRNKFNI